MKALYTQIMRDEEGQDLIEYSLIAGLVSVVCYVAIAATGTSISNLWNAVATAVGNATTAAAG